MPRLEHKFHVVLTAEARAELGAITRMHTVGAAKLRRAKILLMSADGCTDMEISEDVGLCERQVVRVRQKFVKSGVQPALTRATRKDAGVRKVIDGRTEAQLITIACSTPPEGRDHWTLQMLCGEMKRQKIVKSVCPETVRQALKKQTLSLDYRAILHRRKRPIPFRRADGRGPRRLPRNVRRTASADLHG